MLAPRDCSGGVLLKMRGALSLFSGKGPVGAGCTKPQKGSPTALMLGSHLKIEHLTHQVDYCSLLLKAVRRLGKREIADTSELWQIKLVLEFFSSRSHQERLQNHPKRGLFMNSEFLPVVKCTIDNSLDQWLQGNGGLGPLGF